MDDLKMLPKLPLPALGQTLDRYLAAVQALVSPSQFQRTKRLVEQFSSGSDLGPRIQKELTRKRDKEDNWHEPSSPCDGKQMSSVGSIPAMGSDSQPKVVGEEVRHGAAIIYGAYSWWMDDMYFNIKLPVVINSSPGWTFPRQKYSNEEGKLHYASKFIGKLLEYKDILDRRAWPVDRAAAREKGQPLCMEQYYRFFTSYRVPGVEKDHLRSTASLSTDNQHIIVAKDNEFFKVVVKKDGEWLQESSITAQLKWLHENEQPDAETVGILTSMKRDSWAEVRQVMLKDPVNAESMEEIETCLFLVCFDKPLPVTFNRRNIGEERDESNVALQMLHGGGTKFNSCNRWFDKTAQFIFTTDGHIGLCFEHSALEGIAIVQIMDRLLTTLDSSEEPKEKIQFNDLNKGRKLKWRLNRETQAKIQEALFEMDVACKDVDLKIHRYKGYGKNFPKKCRCSPDAYIQVALQIAHYKLHGRLVATYESASTRRFRFGRVDNIRAATLDALHLAQAMIPDSGYTDSEKKKLFEQAIKTQTDIMIQNILGEGIDIHLLGLREMGKEMVFSGIELFDDPSYKTANHFALSTSQVPTGTDSYVYYAAVVPDGYGTSYNPHEEEIVFCISSFKSCPTTRPPAAGKSSLLTRVMKSAEEFPKNYQMTPGIEISTKIIQIPDTDDRVEFIFFDLSGHSFYSKLVHRVAIQPSLFIAVYDVTEENALTAVSDWIEFVKKMGGDVSVPGVLIANKTDLQDLRVISPKKDGKGLEEPFFYLANEWYKLYLEKADGFRTYMVNS
ncbi:unnamed protein product [Notodromas monacha]|uniref:Choline O-acetyltransferase n=1 Tax=Notodromas monacha TaxID=399045 RepID=A0A7R9G9G9_9CRUS|nr:unnamed protein product [Notodromas monacha]CAG0914256.1 unnamed protein product [Notodromas monacha]